MNNDLQPIGNCIPEMLNPEHVREVLDRPFDQEAIKTRPGNFGKSLNYVEAHEYIRRLNEAYGSMWSFNIVQHEILDNEVIVVGKLTTHGFVKMAFGGSSITKAKDSGAIISIADDLKAAATDAFKKSCSFLGLGLHLYQDGNGKGSVNNQSAHGHNNGSTRSDNGNGRLTSRQLEAILSIGRDNGLDREQIRQMSLDRFSRNLEFIGKSEASTLIQELKGSNGNNAAGGGR